jgi:hypothetical protein
MEIEQNIPEKKNMIWQIPNNLRLKSTW